jgi:hypothetical protein
MASDEEGKEAAERLAQKIKTAKLIKAVNPKKPKNADGTTFYENEHPEYKGKHRDS